MEVTLSAIDWIRRLKFPYYAQATEILDPTKISKRYRSMQECVLDALKIDESQEGRQYWIDVANGIYPIVRPAPFVVSDDSGHVMKIHASGITDAIEKYNTRTGRTARQAILI